MEKLLALEKIPKEVLSHLGRVFGLIAHPDRLHILLLLHRWNELCVREMITQTGLSQPRVSQHFHKLRRARLVRCRRVGQKVFYSLSEECLINELLKCMERILIKSHEDAR